MYMRCHIFFEVCIVSPIILSQRIINLTQYLSNMDSYHFLNFHSISGSSFGSSGYILELR